MAPQPAVTHEDLAARLDAGTARFAEIDATMKDIKALLEPIPDMQADIAATRELVEAWAAVKTVGRFLKWLSAIIAAVTTIIIAIKVGAVALIGSGNS